MSPPLVIFCIGNPSRGDDALGPLLAERIVTAGWSGVEVIDDFQLQIEHALDLDGRALALFVDAAVDLDQPCRLTELVAQADASHTTHALSPAAVLAVAGRMLDRVPPAFVLALRGEAFELGAGLSASARDSLDVGWALLDDLRRQTVPDRWRAYSQTPRQY